jgi:hypothetical protein
MTYLALPIEKYHLKTTTCEVVKFVAARYPNGLRQKMVKK